ncbi:FHIPEP family type III secretion protein [Tepidiforma flava]|uniref:FHIPEP family type III secretion protein n=1 Tax=Tepidiforma flava TaxID=3004094 RepID=A0ABY7MC95_9CHLR|nr:FHIPEP family type III secretion protein [Tepidiforma flava]WBL37542.1 FHIPEP family type III secretion protein [Tepidiforma flava]
MDRSKRQAELAAIAARPDPVPEPEQLGPQQVIQMMTVDPLEIEVGYGLIPIVDEQAGGTLLRRITQIRRQLALELGIVLPTVRVRDNLGLAPNAYVVKLRGVEIARGTLQPGHYLAMDPGTAEGDIPGIETVEPAFGLPARWITPAYRERAELLGYTVVDAESVLATHLTELVRRFAPDLLSRQDTQDLLENLRKEYPALVDDLIPSTLTVGEVQEVLQNLLAERVSIRDLVTICETLATQARLTRDIDLLTEYARAALARQISRQYADETGTIRVITVGPRTDQRRSPPAFSRPTAAARSPWPPGRCSASSASSLPKSSVSPRRAATSVILCSSRIRLALRRLLERRLPNVVRPLLRRDHPPNPRRSHRQHRGERWKRSASSVTTPRASSPASAAKLLGPDAVILSTRSLHRDGAPPLVEIIAAPAAEPAESLPLHLQQAVLEEALRRVETAPGITVADLEELAARRGAGPAPCPRAPLSAPPLPVPSPARRTASSKRSPASAGMLPPPALSSTRPPGQRTPAAALERWLAASPSPPTPRMARRLSSPSRAPRAPAAPPPSSRWRSTAPMPAGLPSSSPPISPVRAGARDRPSAPAPTLSASPSPRPSRPGELVRAADPGPIPRRLPLRRYAAPARGRRRPSPARPTSPIWPSRPTGSRAPPAPPSRASPSPASPAPSSPGPTSLPLLPPASNSVAETGLGLAFLSAGRDIAAGIIRRRPGRHSPPASSPPPRLASRRPPEPASAPPAASRSGDSPAPGRPEPADGCRIPAPQP